MQYTVILLNLNTQKNLLGKMAPSHYILATKLLNINNQSTGTLAV